MATDNDNQRPKPLYHLHSHLLLPRRYVPTCLTRPVNKMLYRLQSNRRQEEHDANQRSLSNVASGMCQLPLEIILQISGFCSAEDILCLTATSRNLRFFLTDEVKTGFHTPRRRQELMKRIRRDELQFLASAEEQQVLDSEYRVCSACQTTHLKRFFSTEEMAKSPLSRTCLGTEHMIRLCPCHTLSFKEMKAAKSEMRFWKRYAPAEKARWDNGFPLTRNCVCDIRLRDDISQSMGLGQYSISIRLFLASWVYDDDWWCYPYNMISDKLKRLDLTVCPHRRTSDDWDRSAFKNFQGLQKLQWDK